MTCYLQILLILTIIYQMNLTDSINSSYSTDIVSVISSSYFKHYDVLLYADEEVLQGNLGKVHYKIKLFRLTVETIVTARNTYLKL